MTDEPLNDDREDVIIGRALDALDRVSRVDAPLVEAEPEVLEYLEVLSHMPFDEVEPPASLEDRVVEAARAARAPEVPSLVSRRRKTARIVTLVAAAAIAAAVTLVVIGDSNANHATNSTSVQFASTGGRAPSSQFLGDPNHTGFDLRNSDGQTVAKVVLLPDGEGSVYDTTLARTPGYTYWLWVTGSNGAVRVGTLDQVRFGKFTVHGPMTGATISAEKRGTDPITPGTPVASGSRS